MLDGATGSEQTIDIERRLPRPANDGSWSMYLVVQHEGPTTWVEGEDEQGRSYRRPSYAGEPYSRHHTLEAALRGWSRARARDARPELITVAVETEHGWRPVPDHALEPMRENGWQV